MTTPSGVGWFVGRNLLYHGGDCLGGASILWLRPAASTVVAIVSNGSQLLLRRAMAREKVPKEAERLLFQKEAIADKIAKAFAPVSA